MNEQAQQAMVMAWQQAITAAWPQQAGGEEYSAIQRFMYDEIYNNAKSGTVVGLKMLNASPMTKRQALFEWAKLVRPGGPWDHKERVLAMTAGDNEFTPIPSQGGQIRYDFWSNLHYGFVGVEAGFTPEELRTGADVADLVTRGEVDAGDDLAIRMGIELRERLSAGDLQPHHIEEAIRQHRAELEQTGMVIP